MNKLATAIPLIAGPIIFGIGATLPIVTSLTLEVWLDSTEKSLSLIARNPGAWRTTNTLFVLAAMITIIGITQLTSLLSDNGWGRAGFVLFSIGTLFWIIDLTLRLSVTLWVAKHFVASLELAPFFEPLELWSGVMGCLFMVLSYVGSAALGFGILGTSPQAAWGGLSAIIVGLGSGLLYLVGIPGLWSIPAGAQLGPLLLGIWVLSDPR